MAPAPAELLAAARQSLAAGRHADAARDASEAAPLFRKAGDKGGAAEALGVAVAARVAKGDVQDALRSVTEELERCRSSDDKLGEAKLLCAAVGARLAAGELEEAAAAAGEAQRLAAQLPGGSNAKLEAQALQAAASTRLAQDRPNEAAIAAHEAVELCRKANDKQALGEALHLLAVVHLAKGAPAADEDNAVVAVDAVGPNPREALRHAYEALALFRELGRREGEAAVLNEIAEARLELGYAAEAATAARQALVIFREIGNKRGKRVSLDTIIQAYTAAFQAPKAMEVAKEELALARSSGDKASELAMLRALADICSLMGRPQDALSLATEAATVSKELKDEEAVELLAVAELQRGSGRLSNALQAAEQAAEAARNTGDRASEEQANRLLSEMHVEKGKPEAAPNRAEALEALALLAGAVEDKQAEAFKGAMERLNAVSGFTEEDVQKALAPVLARDRAGAARFLRMVGFEGATEAPPTNMKETNKKELYLSFRLGGLSYGPRFRLCNPSAIRKPASGTHEACAALQVWDEQEDWGKNLCFHPGMLDSMQHTETAVYN